MVKLCRDKAVVATGAALALLFAGMPAWRGLTRAGYESYAVETVSYDSKVAAMVARYKTGEEDGIPVVSPPPGDVYLTAERWRFSPRLELQAGAAYRLHVASRDILHGVVVDGREALLAPGRAAVLPLTVAEPGKIPMVCSEYCGLEHNKMRNWITVVAKP